MTIGFLCYTLLPALGLHTTLAYVKKKVNGVALYCIPAVFWLVALVYPSFVQEGTCQTIFVTVRTYFNNLIPLIIYDAYFVGFIITSCVLFFNAYRKSKKTFQRRVYLTGLIAVLAMTLPTLILVSLFPELNMRLGSMLCHFALLFSIIACLAVYWDEQS